VENIIKRHGTATTLVVMLFVQLLALAYQVRKPTERGPVRLIRLWAVSAITPFEKGFVHSVDWVSSGWHNYAYLRNVRRQNDDLRDEIQRLRLQQVRLNEDAGQARRLQSLLGFKEQYISETMAAQVISSTGSEFTRGVYLDKGARDGIKRDMPVITADGVVGKVYTVFPSSCLVLEINDPSSGAGIILEKSRLQGVLKGDQRGNGETYVTNVMADEKIEPGDIVLTSGGDRVFPKGLPVGTVDKVLPGAESFLNIRVKPAARLDRLEEVLIITRIVEKTPDANEAATGPMRAADILAQRLPTVEPPKAGEKSAPPPTTAELAARERAAKKAAAQQNQPAANQPGTPSGPKTSTPTPANNAAATPRNSDKPKTPSGPPDTSTKEPPH
jgi:rod shape-determining protein MreC